MGGIGSGRSEYATTPSVEDCHIIDVNEFADRVNSPGTSVAIEWGPKGDPDAAIGAHLLPRSGNADKVTGLHLQYSVTGGRAQEESSHDYCIPFEYTECNFGGTRPWFHCPGIVDGEHCNRRVAKLYRPSRSDLFLCRHCYGLGYTSSRTAGDQLKQAELRFRRAYAELDEEGRRPHPNSAQIPYVPDRPKGMHQDMYERLVQNIRTARREWDDAMRTRKQELCDKLRTV